MTKPVAELSLQQLPVGAVVQKYCAPCRDRRATRIVVGETEIRPLDRYNHQVAINGEVTDLGYVYVIDPRRKRWTNLGLLVRCHEEDDVPPTLPADKVAP